MNLTRQSTPRRITSADLDCNIVHIIWMIKVFQSSQYMLLIFECIPHKLYQYTLFSWQQSFLLCHTSRCRLYLDRQWGNEREAMTAVSEELLCVWLFQVCAVTQRSSRCGDDWQLPFHLRKSHCLSLCITLVNTNRMFDFMKGDDMQYI